MHGCSDNYYVSTGRDCEENIGMKAMGGGMTVPAQQTVSMPTVTRFGGDFGSTPVFSVPQDGVYMVVLNYTAESPLVSSLSLDVGGNVEVAAVAATSARHSISMMEKLNRGQTISVRNGANPTMLQYATLSIQSLNRKDQNESNSVCRPSPRCRQTRNYCYPC